MRAYGFVGAALLLFACAPPAEDDGAARVAQEARVGTDARICSWNIRRLGHRFDNRDKDIDGTSAVILDHCDVVVLQEVMQTAEAAAPGYDALLGKLGSSWGGMVAERPRPDSSSPNSERYAFLYRTAVAIPCSNWREVKYIADDEDAFLREPSWTCIKVKNHSRELLLGSYHALYGSLAERRREVSFLSFDLDHDGKADDFFRAMQASRPGAAVLLMGDFNLKPNQLAEVLPTYKDLTAGSGSTLNDHDEITANQYDHLVAPPFEPLAETLRAETIDTRTYAKTDTFFRSISDHLPIRFTLKADTAPPPPSPTESPYGPGSVLPLENGDSPDPAEFGIKGNEQSMLYHTQESPYFRTTKAEVWFRTTEDAERAGFERWRPL